MWIPEQFDPSANSSLRHADYVPALPSGRIDLFSELREWSSLIGIITAISGNILISFALNIQRYAHIRIEREYNQSNIALSKDDRRTAYGPRVYGTTTQEQIAEERAKINAKAPGPGTPKSNGKNYIGDANKDRDQDARENSPLLRTYGSDSTSSTLEKRSEDRDRRKSYVKSPYWWAGIVLMTIGEAGNFLAYGFAPASIVSPLGVVALVSNCIIAPFMLKERFRLRDAWGVLVAVAGAVTVVLSAKNSETKLGPDQLRDAVLRWEFLTYVGITAAVIIALMFASPRYGGRTILIDLGLVGLFGGYTALSTKGVASLLSDTLWRALTFPITYFLVAVLVASALMQIRYVNRSLQRFDSTQVIPTQFVLFTISVIIGSAVLYRDFESTTAARAAKFVGGCLLTFFGVYLITSGRPQDTDGEESITDEEEGIINMVDDEAAYQDRRFSQLQTSDSNISPKGNGRRPPTSDRASSGSITPTNSSFPQTPQTPTPFGFPSTLSSPLESGDERDDQWRSQTNSATDTAPENAPRTSVFTSQPSPFTRAQSLSDPPESPTFSRLRPIQSHQPSPTTPQRLSHRSPSTPTPLDPSDMHPTAHSRPPTPTRLAEAALRAHLSTPAASESDPTTNPTLETGASRGSFGRLLPGPLLSPLSSSLTAVVADSLRRGEGKGRGSVAGRGWRSKRSDKNATSTSSGSKRPGIGSIVRRGASDGILEGEARRAGDEGRGILGGAKGNTGSREDGEGAAQGSETMKRVRGRLQAMSESLSELVGRRREKKSGSKSRSPPPPAAAAASSG